MLPPYRAGWWYEALHRVATSDKGSMWARTPSALPSFPQLLLIAMSFNGNIWFRIGQVWQDGVSLVQTCAAEGQVAETGAPLHRGGLL